jgi:hypothetical protein
MIYYPYNKEVSGTVVVLLIMSTASFANSVYAWDGGYYGPGGYGPQYGTGGPGYEGGGILSSITSALGLNNIGSNYGGGYGCCHFWGPFWHHFG